MAGGILDKRTIANAILKQKGLKNAPTYGKAIDRLISWYGSTRLLNTIVEGNRKMGVSESNKVIARFDEVGVPYEKYRQRRGHHSLEEQIKHVENFFKELKSNELTAENSTVATEDQKSMPSQAKSDVEPADFGEVTIDDHGMPQSGSSTSGFSHHRENDHNGMLDTQQVFSILEGITAPKVNAVAGALVPPSGRANVCAGSDPAHFNSAPRAAQAPTNTMLTGQNADLIPILLQRIEKLEKKEAERQRNEKDKKKSDAPSTTKSVCGNQANTATIGTAIASLIVTATQTEMNFNGGFSLNNNNPDRPTP